jgi:hypothetical protein
MNIPPRYPFCILATAVLAIAGYFISPLIGLGIVIGGLISPLFSLCNAASQPGTISGAIADSAASTKPAIVRATSPIKEIVRNDDNAPITRADYEGEVKTIYVGNLPYRANEAAIRSLFAEHGLVLSVRLVKDRDTGKRRGYGFVEMPAGAADSAIATLNETEYLQRTLKVREANEKKELRPEDESSNSAEL